MISVIMPVMVRSDYTVKTIESLYSQSTGHFDQLIIFIDGLASNETVDAVKAFYETYQQPLVRLHILRSIEWAGVNKARMQCMRTAKNQRLFIVNDDILVSQGWDKHLDTLLDLEKNWVVCPMFTLGDVDFTGKPQKKSDNIAGHAWGLDLSKRGQIGDIPSGLKIWYGDDRIRRRCIDLGHPCHRTDQIIVHHYVSKTVYNDEVKEKVLNVVQSDKEERIKIIRLMGRYDTRYTHL